MLDVLHECVQLFCEWQYLFILGVSLLVLEVVFSEFFLIWVGFGFLFSSLMNYLFHFNTFGTLGCLTIFIIVFITIGFNRYKKRSSGRLTTQHINNALYAIKGTTHPLIKETHVTYHDQYQGAIEINGTRWTVKSTNPLTNVERVIILSIEGSVLWVEPAKA